MLYHIKVPRYLHRVLSFLLLLIFFAILLIGVKNQSHSFYFQDETEHVTLGWMITDFSRDLYHNLSTNHQPLPVLVGALLAKVIPYATFFEFVDRLRLSMWAFALITSAVIVTRYSWRGLLSVLITYSLGHYFFAWHVLAESLVIPAVIWMSWSILDKDQLKLDPVIFGLATFWITFSLLPLWPFVLLANIYYFQQSTQNHRKLQLLSPAVAFVGLFSYINFFEWLQEAVINNLVYFIPIEANNDVWHYLWLLLFPLIHITTPSHVISRFYISAIVIGIAYWVQLQSSSVKRWRATFQPLAMIGLVYLLNTRVSQPNSIFFQGFHAFPYVAGVSVLTSWATIFLYQKLSHKQSNNLLRNGIVITSCLILLTNLSWVWEKRNRLSDYNIQYDTFQAYGAALKTISHPGDSLLTGPDGSGYLNMMANVPLAGRQNFHLEWAYRVPYLRDAWLEMMRTNPPTFIYFNLKDDSYSRVLKPLIDVNYAVLNRADGSPTDLRMRKDALEKVTPEQWQKFEEQAFQKPILQK